jgi:uncharacterized protein (DUF305 family)
MKCKSVLGALTSAVMAGAFVAGCSGNTGSSTGTGAAPTTASSPAVSGESYNDADIAFVQGMIPHHAGAVDMAQLAGDRASNAEVKELARRIEQAQGPEIEQMRGFLAAWGVPEQAEGTGGMDHGNMGHSGMMSEEQVQALENAQGPEFDRMFLEMMIEHHDGAVEMAQTEVAEGQNPDAQALAQKIIGDQQAEIAEMQELLKTV